MLNTVLVLVGAVAAWLLIDHLLSRRDERLRRGRAAWSEVGANRTFHSTGWEETVPPSQEPLKDLPDRRSRQPGGGTAV